MAKTRLNNNGRDALRALARRLVTVPGLEEADKKAYDHLYRLMSEMFDKRWPKSDLEVLKRYDMVRDDTCLRLQCSPGGYMPFSLRKGYAPFQTVGNGCNTYNADRELSLAAVASDDAAKELTAAKEKKLKDYYVLIGSSYTFEAILDVWPEAEQVRGQCGANHVAVYVNEDVINRIQADMATRLPPTLKV